VSAPAGIALVRVDNRLVHGQVLEAWVPALAAQGILVADDEVASSPLARAAMSLAIPKNVAFRIATIADAAAMLRPGGAGAPGPRTLLLVRDVRDAVALRERGAPLPHLNLGNVHFSKGREQVTPTLYLDTAEIEALEQLGATGTHIEARAVPAEAPLTLPALVGRFRSGSALRDTRK
jgi:mannose/fructose/N-acetylgalactosamine-specific phosphotransferase system component IIB